MGVILSSYDAVFSYETIIMQIPQNKLTKSISTPVFSFPSDLLATNPLIVISGQGPVKGQSDFSGLRPNLFSWSKTEPGPTFLNRRSMKSCLFHPESSQITLLTPNL